MQAIEEWLLVVAILGMAALTITNVISRSIFSHSLAFTEELSQFLVILVCFVGLSYAASKGRHIRMTAIYDQLNPRLRKAFMIMISGVTALIMFVLCGYACRYVYTVYQLGGIYPVLRVPFFVVYLSAPLGLFLAGIQYSLAVVRNLTSEGIYLSFEVEDVYEKPLTQEI